MISGTRQGFTLIEIMLVLSIIAVLTALVLTGVGTGASGKVADDAMIFARSFQTARTQALMTAGEVRLEVQEPDRYRVGHVAEGDSLGSLDGGAWTFLQTSSVFGRGNAVVGPLGDTIVTAIPLPEIVCAVDGRCDLGDIPVVTYYVTDTAHPEVVRAITVSSQGDATIYRYLKEGGWK